MINYYDNFERHARRARNWAVFSVILATCSLLFAVASAGYRAGHKAGIKEKCPIEIPGTKIEKNIDKDFWL